ncbi:MAG TPA: hypothetical protein VLG27_03085 [Candidatus Saccharimonadia bacterium]|nr:hypothetical protein [Candidatus Saccharimonadia bacterium]
MYASAENIADFQGVLVRRQYKPGQKYIQLVFKTAEGFRVSLSRNLRMVSSMSVGNTYHIKGPELVLGDKMVVREPVAIPVRQLGFVARHKKLFIILFAGVFVACITGGVLAMTGSYGNQPHTDNKPTPQTTQTKTTTDTAPSNPATTTQPQTRPAATATYTTKKVSSSKVTSSTSSQPASSSTSSTPPAGDTSQITSPPTDTTTPPPTDTTTPPTDGTTPPTDGTPPPTDGTTPPTDGTTPPTDPTSP